MMDADKETRQPPSFAAYPMPPDILFLPSLAALLNPLNTQATFDPTSSSSSSLSNSNKSPSSTPSTPSSAGGFRTSRCRKCLGCKSEPCGKCCYCVDSLPFGGPGIKKQTCIQRKCVVLLENRIQKETTKVRTGCNECAGCKLPDCESCLVCYDKKFLDGKYLTGAICIKKKCFGVSSCELSVQELKKLQKKRPRKRPAAKRTPKPKIQKEKVVKTELPNPKPKRVYKRRPRKTPTVSSPPPPIIDKQDSQIGIIAMESNDLHESINDEKQQGYNPQVLAFDAPPCLSPVPNYTFDTSEIQQCIPQQSLSPLQESQIVHQSCYPPSKNDYHFQHINLHKPWSYKVVPNSIMNSQTFQQPPSSYSNSFNGRTCYRRFRYLRISNNFDSNSFSNEFDPFIPPSYSGNEEVILQAL